MSGDFDWEDLAELRAAYLEGTAGVADYWASDSLVRAYDATFARRIAWKWHHVFRDLARLSWTPPQGAVHDWGCGTGVAAREWLGHFGTEGVGQVSASDRSARAQRFATEAVRREFPAVSAAPRAGDEISVFLVSHVLTELNDTGLAEMLAMARRAQCVVIVEPGTRDASARLVKVRELLRDEFAPVAPCLHSGTCGLLAGDRLHDWCHFFATPPSEVFQDAGWAFFSREMGIDLRALPLSYLVMDKRPVPPRPPQAVRLLGSHRIYKGYALLQACTESGVDERRLTKRTDPLFFRRLGKGRTDSLQHWQLDGDEITSATDRA